MRSLVAVLFLLAASPLAAGAQGTSSGAPPESYATLSGTVTNAETGAPLPDANVFIAASTMGTSTDARGRFLLRRIPLGAQQIRVSMVGFAAADYDTLLTRPETYRLAVRLAPTVTEAGRLTVSAKRDAKWAKRLRRFERSFLGTSERTQASTLLNPEVLSFDTKWWGRFTAEAARPLIIENDSLGYRLTYFLKAFDQNGGRTRWDGDPLFEPLTPADSAQAARWQAHRRAAYKGSVRHFLRALLAGRTREEGFLVYQKRRDHLRPGSPFDGRRRVRRPERFLSADSDAAPSRLHFRGLLEVVYRGEETDPAFAQSPYVLQDYGADVQASYLELNDGAVTVDRTGEVVEPYGMTLYGYFAFERVADLMIPKEYQPEP